MQRTHRWFWLGPVALILALSISSVFAAGETVQVTQNPTLGNILTDSRGMTLYVFTKDTPNVTNCYGGCATAWPALTVPDGQAVTGAGLSGKLDTIQRKEGTHQVTYNGQPLYFFAKDTAPGDINGQNVGNVWFVVKVATAPAAGTASLPATGSGSVLQSESTPACPCYSGLVRWTSPREESTWPPILLRTTRWKLYQEERQRYVIRSPQPPAAYAHRSHASSPCRCR